LRSLYTIDDELVDAVFLADLDDVRTLLARGADPDARDEEHRTLLMNATMDSQRDLVRVLLEAGADPNLRDDDGWTPLDVAVYRRALDLIWLLVHFGADVNAQDTLGISVLLRAVLSSNGSPEIVDLLQRWGARDDLPKSPRAATLARHFGIALAQGSQPVVD
jgi:ankyrin repeat protein